MEGFLLKRSEWLHAWNERFFVVEGSSLLYYIERGGKLKGSLPLRGAKIQLLQNPPSDNDFRFEVQSSNGQRFVLRAPDHETRAAWYDVIEAISAGSTVSRDGGFTTLGNGGFALSALLNGLPTPKPLQDTYQEVKQDIHPSLNKSGREMQFQSNMHDQFKITAQLSAFGPSQTNDSMHKHAQCSDSKSSTMTGAVQPVPNTGSTMISTDSVLDPLSYLMDSSQPPKAPSALQQLESKQPASAPTIAVDESPRRLKDEPETSTLQNMGSGSLGYLKEEPKSAALQSMGSIDAAMFSTDMQVVTKDYDVSVQGLRSAIKDQHVEQVRRILGVNPVLASHADSQGESMLHLAVIFGSTPIALALVTAGASTEVQNQDGKTPVDIAAPLLRKRIVELLRSV